MGAALKKSSWADTVAVDGCFLGVKSSARGFRWTERLAPGRQAIATAIAQRHDLPELLGRVLAARGCEIETAAQFLNPSIKDLLPDPHVLMGMEQLATRLARAIMQREKIAVFGDYDVDGAASSALLARFLAAHGLTARIYIPDRIAEGYGPNPAAINALIDEGATLIVTVDCGTASHEALKVGRERGVDVLVIDHHQADAELPDVHALVNPNRQDDLSGLGYLCAAGVVFTVLVATLRALRAHKKYDGALAPNLLEWLDIVALATVCDVVPLEGLNRAFVAKGLQVMQMRRNAGLRALSDASGLNSIPTPYHLGFLLGPRINAGGRIGDAALGARLLAIDDEAEATRIAALLDRLNRERKEMEQTILEEAISSAERDLENNPDMAMVFAGSQDWHKGLVGLVASRLTDRFRRPSCVIAWDAKDQGTGSLRSIAGVDIGGAVRAAVAEGLLVKGGGHAMAAGLTVTREKYAALQEFFTARLGARIDDARESAGLEVDGALTPRSVNRELIDLIERAGPYGQGNPTPRFVFPAHVIRFAKVVGESHVRCVLESGDGSKLDAIAFRAVGSPLGDMLTGSGGLPVHVAGSLRRDTWGGREKLELFIDDAADPRAQR